MSVIRAAAQAVPKSVTIDAKDGKELLQLLTRSCSLGAVESVRVTHEEVAEFTQGALFARICAEATCLCEVHMPEEYFHELALVPATLKKLTLGGFERAGNSLAPLARLTQLKKLDMQTLELSIEDSAKNFCPEVFPPSLRCIVLECDPIIGESLVFPVGNVVIGHGNHIEWTCP